MYLYYLGLRNETHSEETNVSCFNLSAVNHSRSNVLWGGAVTENTVHLTEKNTHLLQRRKTQVAFLFNETKFTIITLSPSLA